jgi:hypothetical protein
MLQVYSSILIFAIEAIHKQMRKVLTHRLGWYLCEMQLVLVYLS